MQSYKKNFLVPVFVLAASLLMVACSPSSDDKKTPTVDVLGDDRAGYVHASCQYKYNEGPVASAKSSASVKTIYFGKKLDSALLKPVLGAGASEVVHFAESTGVRYYHTSSYKSNTCDMLSVLPSAPSDIQAEFTRAGESVLGLYLPANTKDLPSTQNLAAITVRKDANKWVLVHEYVHHLFQLQFMADRTDSEDLKDKVKRTSQEYETAEAALKAGTSATRAPLVKTSATKLYELSTAFQSLLEHFLLEEMTIESMLGEKLVSGEFTYVEPKQRNNGAAYVISSSKKANEYFDLIKREVSTFQMTYSMDLDSEASQKLDETVSAINTKQSEMATLVSRARNYLLSQGIDYNGFASFNQSFAKDHEGHMNCSHGQIPAEVEQAFSRLARKNRRARSQSN